MSKKMNPCRRDFLKTSLATSISFTALGFSTCSAQKETIKSGAGMQFGLVTYLWGKDWDLPTLITNCETTDVLGVELRTEHAHGVEPSLSAAERLEVKKRFADSPVTCLGYGSNQEYHSPDPDELKRQIDGSFELIKLCHDIGASGLKVKPNTLPEGVPQEKTIGQIGESLNTVGKFAQDYGQEIRVEVHGRLTQLPANMNAIFEHVTESNVKICWNCNDQDLVDTGLEYNFNMLKKWFGSTVHVRELNIGDYPYQQLMDLFVGMDYAGWILLEARTNPDDRVAALKEQRQLFAEMIKNAQAKIE
ncbi:sugar phosphate isomerase/epimerase [candidate division KSB1 bacterium]|nr:sugar phosphate isomerase/epimerase [candidate division KSB1 bacterium]